MKRTRKKVLGLFCLGLVVAMTVFAAILPAPETQATTTVTDVIQVRVVGSVPDVNMSGIVNESIFTSSDHSITVTYENVNDLDIKVKYKDADGVEYITSLLEGLDGHVDYYAGEVTVNFDFIAGTYSYINKDGEEVILPLEGYGYGEYYITTTGIGWEGAEDSDYTSFSLLPVYGDVDQEQVEEDYEYHLNLHYTPKDETGTGGEVTHIVVEVYDKNGNKVIFSPLEVDAPEDRIELPFADYGLEDGKYTIKIYAYDEDKLLYKNPYVIEMDYVAKVPKVPDTGELLQGLNISQTDYLITGLMIFGLVAVCGVVFIMKNDKKKSTRRRK